MHLAKFADAFLGAHALLPGWGRGTNSLTRDLLLAIHVFALASPTSQEDGTLRYSTGTRFPTKISVALDASRTLESSSTLRVPSGAAAVPYF